MGCPGQVYWSGLPLPPPRHLPDPEIEPVSPASPALIGGFFTTESPGNPTGLYVVWKSLPLVYNHWDCFDLQSLVSPHILEEWFFCNISSLMNLREVINFHFFQLFSCCVGWHNFQFSILELKQEVNQQFFFKFICVIFFFKVIYLELPYKTISKIPYRKLNMKKTICQ